MTRAPSKRLRLHACFMLSRLPTCRLYHVWPICKSVEICATLTYAYAGLAESLEIMQSCDLSVEATVASNETRGLPREADVDQRTTKSSKCLSHDLPSIHVRNSGIRV